MLRKSEEKKQRTMEGLNGWEGTEIVGSMRGEKGEEDREWEGEENNIAKQIGGEGGNGGQWGRVA